MTGTSGGSTSLPQPGNAAPVLADFSAGGGFAFDDAVASGVTLASGAVLNGGAGGVTLANTGPLTIAGALTSTGGPASLTAGLGDLVLTGSVNAAGQTLTLVSAGNLSQAGGAIAAGVLTGSAPGQITLGQPGNNIVALGDVSAGAGFALTDAAPAGLTLQPGRTLNGGNGAVSLANAGSITVAGTLSGASGPLSLTSTGGDLVLGGLIDAAGQTLTLNASGAIAQTAGVISASLLTGASGGATSLSQPGNAVAAIGAFQTGAGFSLGDTAPAGLTVGAGSQIDAGSGGVSLANAGPLTIAGTLDSTGGMVSLETTVGGIVLSGALNAAGQTLSLVSASDLSQTGGSIATALLTGASASGTSLDRNNTISALGDFSAGAGFRLNDTAPTGLTIVSGATISGGTGQLSLSSAGGLTVAGTLVSTGGQASLTTAGGGDITLAGGVNAAGQTLILNASGAVSQTGGAIAAALLSGASTGPTSLNGSGNAVAAIGGYSAGSGFALRDATVGLGGLTLASGATLDGGMGGVSLGNTGAVIIAGTLNSPHGPASLTAATPLGDIDLSGVINAPNQTLVLTASGGVAQTGGSITTALLTGSSTGATSLTQAVNAVTAIGDYHAGAGFALTSAGSLTVSGTLTSTSASTALTTTSGDIVLAGAVNAAGQTLSLNAPGAISQTGGSVSANLLTGASGGATTFVQAGNTVSTIGDFSAGAGFSLSDAAAGGLTLGAGHTLQGGAGGVTLANAGPLTIAGALTSTGGPASLTAGLGDLVLTGSVNAAGQTLTLVSASNLSQAGGAIAAGVLTGSAPGQITLGQPGNNIMAMGDVSAGAGFALTDAAAAGLTLQPGRTLNGGNGAVSLGNTGPLQLAGAIDATGQTLNLTSGGAVTQVGGAILGGTLTGSAQGGVSLVQPGNAIAALGNFTVTSGGFSLIDAQALTVAGALAAHGQTALTTLSGDLVLAGAIDTGGQTLSLTSAGAIAQTGGVLSASTLTGAAAGGVSLTQYGNVIPAIGGFSAGGAFTLQDSAAGGLTLLSGATLSASGVSLINSGPLTVDGANLVSSKDISLTAAAGSLRVITPAGAPAGFTSLTAAGLTSLRAPEGSVVIGEAPFVQAVSAFLASHPGAELNVARNIPAVQPPTQGRVFLTSGSLQVTASVGVVQQNTEALVGRYSGIVLTNPGRAGSPISISGGSSAPSVVDLFGSVVNASGATLTGNLVATSGLVNLSPPPSNSYRINGCVIGQAGVCTVLTDAIVNIQPANLTGDLFLDSLPKSSASDATVAGTGNEEIWRKHN